MRRNYPDPQPPAPSSKPYTDKDGVVYKPLPPYDGELITDKPSQGELDKALLNWLDQPINDTETLLVVFEDGKLGTIARVPWKETKAAINSLTLKQVLSLIGEDGYPSNNDPYAFGQNILRRKLRASAERIWS